MIAFGFVVIAFAAWVTLHVALVSGLTRRTPRWRALAALVVPPLAPVFAFRSGMPRRAVSWCVALAIYLVGLAAIGR